jgi:hypothetical protein
VGSNRDTEFLDGYSIQQLFSNVCFKIERIFLKIQLSISISTTIFSNTRDFCIVFLLPKRP